MKILISFLIFFSISVSSFSQIDSERIGIAIPAEDTEDPKDDPELIIEPVEEEENDIKPDDSDNTVTAPKDAKTEQLPKKEFSMIEKNNLRSSGELFKEQLDRQLKFKEDDEKSNNGSLVNQFLGEYRTTAKAVNIIYRDHQYPDGDMIRVFINKDIVVPSVVLTSGFNGLLLPLDEGINEIDFLALNQGTSGPNTAEFQILDEFGNIIAANQWNLATGVKATITVVKEKESPLKLKSQSVEQQEKAKDSTQTNSKKSN